MTLPGQAILVITLSDDVERHQKLKNCHVQLGVTYHVCKPWTIYSQVRDLALGGVVFDNYTWDKLSAESQETIKNAMVTSLAARGLTKPSDLFTFPSIP